MELYILDASPQRAAESLADEHLTQTAQHVATQLIHAQLQILEDLSVHFLTMNMKGRSSMEMSRTDLELERRLEKARGQVGPRTELADAMRAHAGPWDWYVNFGVELMNEYSFRLHVRHPLKNLVSSIRVEGRGVVTVLPAIDPRTLVESHRLEYFRKHGAHLHWGGRSGPSWWKRMLRAYPALASSPRGR